MLGTRVVKTGFPEEGAWSLQRDHELGTGRPREKGINTKVSEPEALSGCLVAEPERVRAGKLRYVTRKSQGEQDPTSSER